MLPEFWVPLSAVSQEALAAAAGADGGEAGTERHVAHVRKVRRMAPWRGPDPKPVDTWRNNYLDNEGEEETRR